MSLHEGLLVSSILMVSLSILWKWGKIMLILVNIEVVSALILASIFISGLLSFVVLLILLFFVCEALILLSAMLSQMHSLGSTYSIISFR